VVAAESGQQLQNGLTGLVRSCKLGVKVAI